MSFILGFGAAKIPAMRLATKPGMRNTSITCHDDLYGCCVLCVYV